MGTEREGESYGVLSIRRGARLQTCHIGNYAPFLVAVLFLFFVFFFFSFLDLFTRLSDYVIL